MTTDIAKERDILAKTYNIVDELAARAPAANFPLAVQSGQDKRVFHDMLDHVEEMGISPATFIAVHALAQCADSFETLPGGDTKALNDSLFDSVQSALGPDIYNALRQWMAGLRMDDAALAHATPWAKLGAMSKSLQVVDVFAPAGVQISPQHMGMIPGLIESQGRVAEACKDLGPGLYGYYTGRLEEMIRAVNKGPAVGGGPGMTPG